MQNLLLIILVATGASCSTNDQASASICTGYPNWIDSDLVLPFPIGTSAIIAQGNCAHPDDMWNSHQVNTPWQYAYDFLLPIGSIITATKGGIVAFVRDVFTDEDKDIDQCNIIVIEHSDGTYSGYGHLTHDGALVEVGDMVVVGDTIGLSGNSGLSAIPHLHYQVGPCFELQNCGSLPITFRNTDANPNSLIAGKSYKALSF